MENQDSNGKFKKGNNLGNRFTEKKQPENPGRKGKALSQFLKEIGNSKSIKFSILMVNADGKEIDRSGEVESNSDINEVLAMMLFYEALTAKSAQNRFRAITEILDRTEGKTRQSIAVSSKERKTEQPLFASREELETRLIEIVLESGIDIQKIIEKYKNSSIEKH